MGDESSGGWQARPAEWSGEGRSHWEPWREGVRGQPRQSLLGRGTRQCGDVKARACLVCFGKEARVAGVEQAMGRESDRR